MSIMGMFAVVGSIPKGLLKWSALSLRGYLISILDCETAWWYIAML
jgi:hypothetical protein